MNYRQSVVTFLGLLNALPLTAKASSATDTPSEKFASMVERGSIPADLHEYALTQLNMDLQSDKGRRDLFLLLSSANPTQVQDTAKAECLPESPEESEVFATLKERIGTCDPKIIDDLFLMVMGGY